QEAGGLSPHDTAARRRSPGFGPARRAPAVARMPAVALGVEPHARTPVLSAVAALARDRGTSGRPLELLAVTPPHGAVTGGMTPAPSGRRCRDRADQLTRA